MGYIFWGRDITNCRKRICWLGLQWASTRAYNTRGNYFLPTREMTSTAAWSLSSETLGISRYFCYEINEHSVVLSLKGNCRDVGERDKVLLWIPFVSLLMMAFSILLHERWLKSALIFIVFVGDVTVHFSSKYISVCASATYGNTAQVFWTSGKSQLPCFRLLLHFWFPSKILWNQSLAASLLSNNEPALTV